MSHGIKYLCVRRHFHFNFITSYFLPHHPLVSIEKRGFFEDYLIKDAAISPYVCLLSAKVILKQLWRHIAE